MKKIFFIATFIIFSALLFLNSCSNEDPVNKGKPDLININLARECFNSTPIKIKKNIYFSNELDWERGHFENDTLSIPILSNKPILIKILKNRSTSKYLYPFLLITKNKSNNTYDYNLKVFIATNSNGFDKESYHLYDTNNKLILNKEKLRIKETSKKSKSSAVECELWGMFSTNLETGEEKLLYTWWQCSDSNQPEQAPPGNGGGGEAISCGPGYIQDEYGNCVLDDQIIVELTGKVKCIYDKLMNSNSGFKNSILKFDGEFPVSHLKLTINNTLASNVYGETQPPVDFVTEIQFNENSFTSLSDLGAATVFAHEIIHAEIFRKMLSAAQRGTLNSNTPEEQVILVNSLKNNFPGLYDYYERRWKPTWNHEMMANHYRSIIADMIQQFDNNRLPRSTYEAVAWVGLGKLDKNVTTIAWDNLPPDVKASIDILIRDNFYNGPKNCN